MNGKEGVSLRCTLLINNDSLYETMYKDALYDSAGYTFLMVL